MVPTLCSSILGISRQQSKLTVMLRIGLLVRAHDRHFHREMLQVTLSLVDIIFFHGVMTAVVMCVAVKYCGVLENR